MEKEEENIDSSMSLKLKIKNKQKKTANKIMQQSFYLITLENSNIIYYETLCNDILKLYNSISSHRKEDIYDTYKKWKHKHSNKWRNKRRYPYKK